MAEFGRLPRKQQVTRSSIIILPPLLKKPTLRLCLSSLLLFKLLQLSNPSFQHLIQLSSLRSSLGRSGQARWKSRSLQGERNVARLHVAIQPKRLRVLANLSQARRDLIYILLQRVLKIRCGVLFQIFVITIRDIIAVTLGCPQDNPRTPLGRPSVTCRRHVPVVYSLHDP